MGYFGSCEHEYVLDEAVDELAGVSVLLDGRIDDFIGGCPKCKTYFDVGGEIVAGKVVNVFILHPVKKLVL